MKSVYVLQSSDDQIYGIYSTPQNAMEMQPNQNFKEINKNVEWYSEAYRIICFPID